MNNANTGRFTQAASFLLNRISILNYIMMNISEYTHDLDIFIKVDFNGTQFYRDVNKEMPENAIFLSVLICHSRVAKN